MSEIKVNKISPRSGTTVTLGDSGDTFTIPSGATINNQGTATNFGATGSASWTTTVKTGDFTAVAGEGYFVDTSSDEVEVSLPAGTAGAVVAIADYAANFGTNNVVLIQNGSDKIGGSTINARLKVDGLAATLIFIDSTKGWIVTDDGLQSSASTASFVAATGGTENTSGNFKIHTFTGPGTFCVSSAGNTAGSNTVSYMVIAGGGGGGTGRGGGGGAGGYRESKSPSCSYTASPIAATGGLAVPVAPYPITVGAGGAKCVAGSQSIFSSITSAGGGRSGGHGTTAPTMNGGSGGGGGAPATPSTGTGGAGNTPPVSPPQGNNGGNSPPSDPGGGGGGGGAGAVGTNASGAAAGPGGCGTTTEINASPVTRAGGGGGGYDNRGGGPIGSGGPGGGGAGLNAGTANTGGGGGGGNFSGSTCGAAGGSGIVIIRYKFQ
jgi:hypothetical protein